MVLLHRDRTPNTMPDVEKFLSACKMPNHPDNNKVNSLFYTDAGSINGDGVEGSFKAPSLSPFHPQFEISLEPKIRPLVFALVDLGYLSYTSCEGHQINNTVYEAHVGLLIEKDDSYKTCIENLKPLSEHGLTLLSHKLWDLKYSKNYKTIELYVLYDLKESYFDYREKISRIVRITCKKLGLDV